MAPGPGGLGSGDAVDGASGTHWPAGMTHDTRRAIVDQTILQLAEFGFRGATLRRIGKRSGINFARLTDAFGDKGKLIAACFAEVVERDLARLATVAEECGSSRYFGALLWALCADAGGMRRTDYLVLTELLLSSARPELNEIFCSWILRRRDLLRAAGERCGIDPLTVDILGLIVLMECGFAISNFDSLDYRVVAELGLEEAMHLLMGIPRPRDDESEALVAYYYRLPPIQVAPGQDSTAEGSKNEIVNAAAEIFLERGPERLTNRAVATRAGVSLALTTYYFSSMTELTLAAVRRAVERLAPVLKQQTTKREERGADMEVEGSPVRAPKNVVQINSGFLHVSLAAARVTSEAQLGHLMRRQSGTLAYTVADGDNRDGAVSRSAAAAHALWWGGGYLVARHFLQDQQPYDFGAQAKLSRRSLLGMSNRYA
jgi:AcrR family transcriptional regulator